jgi:TonB family protein
MHDRKQIPPLRRLPQSASPSANAIKQQRMMVAAFIMLVIALIAVLYHDRDFWFPDQQLVQEQSEPTSASRASSTSTVAPKQAPASPKTRAHHHAVPEPQIVQEPGPAVTTVRTVLPPLDVEVVAGDSHRNLHPSSNSVKVDLQRGAAPSRARSSAPAENDPEPAQVVKAAERVEVSANAADLVTHSVTPGYPTLARQMKVQGSVIMLAVIGRDGLIQQLRLVSGPPILAGAAQEAVRQWHFKPHYIGAEPVETQAKITVNFTISTN